LNPEIGRELYNIIDALVALKMDLSCDPALPGESLVLSAGKARDACDALESATTSIKKIAVALNGQTPGDPSRH
jgi:hypothetical protein